MRPLRGGEKGDGKGWWGCEYFKGCMMEKYLAISSEVGAWRKKLLSRVTDCE